MLANADITPVHDALVVIHGHASMLSSTSHVVIIFQQLCLCLERVLWPFFFMLTPEQQTIYFSFFIAHSSRSAVFKHKIYVCGFTHKQTSEIILNSALPRFCQGVDALGGCVPKQFALILTVPESLVETIRVQNSKSLKMVKEKKKKKKGKGNSGAVW